MSTVSPALSAMVTYLDAYGIPYILKGSSLDIQDSVLFRADIGHTITQDILAAGLPDDMTVRGVLLLSNTGISRLPERLTVIQDVDMENTAVQRLPETVSIGGTLLARGSRLMSLPRGFSLGGGLDLGETPIDTLPDGLVIGDELYLDDTSITAFPEDMQVGSCILPPHGLNDIRRFMAGRPGPISLSIQGSHHHRVALHAALHKFPDLYRVVIAAGDENRVEIIAKDGAYRASFFSHIEPED